MTREARSKKVRRAAFDVPAIKREIEYIVGRALRHEGRMVSLGPLIFFSTDSGDAWMLDPSDGNANCLMRDGSRRSPRVEDCGARVEIEWAGFYRIDGDTFTYVDSTGRAVTVLGYPTREIEAAAMRILR